MVVLQTAEKNKLKDRLIAAKQELQKLQIQVCALSSASLVSQSSLLAHSIPLNCSAGDIGRPS